MKILFVCRSNMFRSRIACTYFKKLNKNRNIKVSGAGIIKGDYPLNSIEVKICIKLGLNIDGKPKGISWELLRKSDLIVIVADDVPKELFYPTDEKKIRVWNIGDVKKINKEEIVSVVEKVKNKVKE